MRTVLLFVRPRVVPQLLVSQLQFQIGKAKIPRILLGTSPFIGAGQFGRRATFYINFESEEKGALRYYNIKKLKE